MKILPVVMTVFGVSCASLWQVSSSLPQNYEGLPVSRLVEVSQEHGIKVLRRVYYQLRDNNKLKEAGRYILSAVRERRDNYDTVELVNIVHLYQLTADPEAETMFRLLTAEKSPVLVELGWQVATVMPSAGMGKAIAEVMTSALTQGRDRSLFIPQAASAVIENKVAGVYTVLRQGLHHTHNEVFAKAMAAINPQQAASDFIIYLALASVEELRQQTLTTVNIYACVLMLHHLKRYPVSPHQRRFDILFWYAISRNPALSNLAVQVLEGYYRDRVAHVAQLLARLPYWAQFAYVERLGRQLTPLSRKFLVILKQKTSGVDVIDEINQVIR